METRPVPRGAFAALAALVAGVVQTRRRKAQEKATRKSLERLTRSTERTGRSMRRASDAFRRLGDELEKARPLFNLLGVETARRARAGYLAGRAARVRAWQRRHPVPR